MTSYETAVATQKKYRGNVVIRIAGQYFAIRQPDSGLSIDAPFDRCVGSLILNPTQVDIRRVTTTIASYSFRLVDLQGAITAMVNGDASSLHNQEVEVWLGRSGVEMDFSEYYRLPTTRVKGLDHADNAYNFSSSGDADRMDRPLYSLTARLAGDILAGTTTITSADDLSDFPSSGFLKIDDEFISYSGVNVGQSQFTGCIRGEFGSVPAAHSALAEIIQTESVTDHPISILLKVLTSGGGGGSYDTLQDGLGISASLIDLDEIETLRDEVFGGLQFSFKLYGIESALKFIENEILLPNNLRFTYSRNAKLTIAVLDKPVFVEQLDVIDENSIVRFPQWRVDGNKISNNCVIDWDYDDVRRVYLQRSKFTEEDSIATYGKSPPLSFQFKGIRAALDGAEKIQEFGESLLTRIGYPRPEVTLTTHIDKSLQDIGNKTRVESRYIPGSDGTLNFASEMEIVSRAINFTSGDVQFKLAFTSFTGIRSCFVAPSDSIQAVTSQKKVTLPSGRGDAYQVGWKVRLWDVGSEEFAADAANTIVDISGDELTFQQDWTTTLTGPGDFKLKFADYDQVAESQKRYCFVSDGASNFPDGGAPYRVTY